MSGGAVTGLGEPRVQHQWCVSTSTTRLRSPHYRCVSTVMVAAQCGRSYRSKAAPPTCLCFESMHQWGLDSICYRCLVSKHYHRKYRRYKEYLGPEIVCDWMRIHGVIGDSQLNDCDTTRLLWLLNCTRRASLAFPMAPQSAWQWLLREHSHWLGSTQNGTVCNGRHMLTSVPF